MQCGLGGTNEIGWKQNACLRILRSVVARMAVVLVATAWDRESDLESFLSSSERLFGHLRVDPVEWNNSH